MKSKLETHISPYTKEIESWAQQGVPHKDIARKLGVSYTTFRKYVKADEKLAELLRNGKRRAKRKVAKALAEPIKPRKAIPKAPLEIPAKQGTSKRPDQSGTHRKQFERNKKKIFATQSVCGICGKPVDFGLKYPHPLSPCIDHIIPVSRGGHPSAMDNLQLAHMTCNRAKSDMLVEGGTITRQAEVISNRCLPHTFDWTHLDRQS